MLQVKSLRCIKRWKSLRRKAGKRRGRLIITIPCTWQPTPQKSSRFTPAACVAKCYLRSTILSRKAMNFIVEINFGKRGVSVTESPEANSLHFHMLYCLLKKWKLTVNAWAGYFRFGFELRSIIQAFTVMASDKQTSLDSSINCQANW